MINKMFMSNLLHIFRDHVKEIGDEIAKKAMKIYKKAVFWKH